MFQSRRERRHDLKMKKWGKAVLFVIPLLLLVAGVNWYVDSYAYLRVTYDEIGAQMSAGRNVGGLEESDFNDRNLLLAYLRQQKEPKELIILGSSRVFNFDHTMFGTDSFYNAGLSEATIYDLLAVAGILMEKEQLPETMIIGVDAFLFNSTWDNDRWKELEEYVHYMEMRPPDEAAVSISQKSTGRNHEKWLSLDYFRYNITLLPQRKRFEVSYTDEWETEQYLKHYDGSVAYQRTLREVDVNDVTALTERAIEEQVVYRMTDYHGIDEKNMALFSDLIDHLQEQGVKVILYLPPYSPMLYDYIESEEMYHITLEVEEQIQKLAAQKQAALYGSYDPGKCGLQMTDLYDAYHIKTEKMMDTFFPVYGAD